jgi:hypothetical protein
MLNFTRRVVYSTGLLAVLGLFTATAAVKADDSNDDYWRRQQEITNQLERGETPYQGNPNDANEYWKRQQEIQQAQDRLPSQPNQQPDQQ